jgi:hypothetical protein
MVVSHLKGAWCFLMVKRKGVKGQVSMYIVTIVALITIVLIAAVIAPMGVLFNTKLYAAGEGIIRTSNQSLNQITNATMRAEIQEVLNGGLDNIYQNITVNNDIFKYGWIMALLVTSLVAFLYTRRVVEFSGGGFV